MRKNKYMRSRREFIKSSAVAGGISLLPGSISTLANPGQKTYPYPVKNNKSVIGSYGPWANTLLEDPPELSYRRNHCKDLESWRSSVLEKSRELISEPDIGDTPDVTIHEQYRFDGLEIEKLSWQLPYGRRTEAILLKPAGANGLLPGILGLHDHGGNKYFGKRKITRNSEDIHPMMVDHQINYYGNYAWANELARRGYVVLVHDAFTFASRRVLFEDMKDIGWGHASTEGMSDENPEEKSNIEAYNRWAAEHEHIMAKSLFCAGTTWPGVFLAEDRIALNVLSNRSEVDSARLGCAGLSGGGLRTVFLGGLDHRIGCAVTVGFMSTWSDFLMYKSYTHTWMTYVPLLPNYLDFPEILGLRVPLPTMILNNNQDDLFTLDEMKRADHMLMEVFEKAEASDRYQGKFYKGPHKFDAAMQQDAFEWFDRWLG